MLSILLPNHNEEYIHDLIQEAEETSLAAEIIIAVDRDSRGKGWAMREALSQATGEHIVFLDSDGDIRPRMLKRLLPFLEDFDIVVGTKRVNHAPFHRKVLTHLSRIYIRIMFGLQVDTQTGIKLFKREALSDWGTDGFAFDIEVLQKAQRKGLRMIDVPIEAEITAPMSLKIIWRTLCESLRIKFLS